MTTIEKIGWFVFGIIFWLAVFQVSWWLALAVK